MKKFFSLVLIVLFSITTNTSTFAQSYNCTQIYTDVNANTVGCEYIGFMRSQNIMVGYGNNTFGPEDELTRGQLAKVVVKSFNLIAQDYQNHSFPDVPSDYLFYKDINTLKALGIVVGFQDGTYKPEEKITRAAVMKLLIGAARYHKPELFPETSIDITSIFTDVVQGNSLTPYVARVYAVNDNKIQGGRIINGYGNNTFGPEDKMSRAQIAVVLTNTIKYAETQQVACNNYFCE
jgi:hypothetical protein